MTPYLKDWSLITEGGDTNWENMGPETFQGRIQGGGGSFLLCLAPPPHNKCPVPRDKSSKGVPPPLFFAKFNGF